MVKERLHHDEFHGEITKKDWIQLDLDSDKYEPNFDEDYYDDWFLNDDEFFKKYEYRTDYPKAPPMDEMFDESDKETDYDDEYEK